MSFSEIIKDWLVKPLRDQHVKPKSKATFKCELFKDTPNVKWFKGDEEITPSDKVELKKDGKDMSLTINNCQPSDVAEYTIAVEDRRYAAKLTLGGRFQRNISVSYQTHIHMFKGAEGRISWHLVVRVEIA